MTDRLAIKVIDYDNLPTYHATLVDLLKELKIKAILKTDDGYDVMYVDQDPIQIVA